MNSDLEYARGERGERALVARFNDRATAYDAAKRLRTEGFHKTWIGVTSAGSLESADDSTGAKIGRFLSGKADGGSLTETLVRHGISATEAERIEGAIEPDDVILTVDGNNHPELAAQIIEDFGGNILAGESFVLTTIDWAQSEERLGSELLGYKDPDLYARGERVDDEGYTRLRNERLGSNTVPTLREDIFILSYEDDDYDETTPGRRSAGGAIGTQHRDEVEP